MLLQNKQTSMLEVFNILNNYVDLSTSQTIKAQKTFDGEQKFLNTQYCPTISDTASGIGCAFKASRGLFNEALVDKIVMTGSTKKIPFVKYTGTSGGSMTGVTEVASIDENGTLSTNGVIAVNNQDGINTFRVASSLNTGLTDHKNQLAIMKNGNTVLNRWKMANGTYTHQSGFYFGDKSLQLYNASEGKTYNFFGEHNLDLLKSQVQNIMQGGNVSMIRKIQRGTISGTTSSSNIEITLSGFTNVDKMMVLIDGDSKYERGSNDGMVFGYYLVSLTPTKLSVRATKDVGSITCTGSYQVIEFY